MHLRLNVYTQNNCNLYQVGTGLQNQVFIHLWKMLKHLPHAEHSSILEASIIAVCNTEKCEMHTVLPLQLPNLLNQTRVLLSNKDMNFQGQNGVNLYQGRKCFLLLPNNYLTSSSLETSRSITMQSRVQFCFLPPEGLSEKQRNHIIFQHLLPWETQKGLQFCYSKKDADYFFFHLPWGGGVGEEKEKTIANEESQQ